MGTIVAEPMRSFWKIAVAASLFALLGARLPDAAASPPSPVERLHFDGTLSVLTYNVKGLPWPVALGRDAALDQIALRLRIMRQRGRAPHVIVLQEAFTPEAQEIGKAAGYRYAASGMAANETAAPAMSHADNAFAADASWLKGETEGKYVGSGLMILSDYPIVAVRRMAFPAFACAGFDCLANKGALLVRLDIPGAPTPVEVVTTHLNSRKASHVPDERSIFAYRRQVEELTGFVRRQHDPRFPLIVAGDFNVGSALPRRSALLEAANAQWVPNAPVRNALSTFQQQGGTLIADAAYSLERARDWQFYSDGTAQKLTLTGIDVPFGHEPSGEMLSDHVGYVARFRLDAPGASPSVTSFDRSKA